MTLLNKYQTEFGSLFFPQEGINFTASEFQDGYIQLANELKDQGVNSDSKIILNLSNSSRFCLYLFACWSLEACVIPLSPKSSLQENDWIIQKSRPQFIVDSDKMTKTEYTIETGHKMALILFTSGSTGKPKGVPISFNQLDLKFQTLSRFIPGEDLKKTLCFLPLNFGHGLISNFLFPFLTKNDVYLIDFSDLSFAINFSDFVLKNNITFFSSVPSALRMIIKLSPPAKKSSLKRIHCASAAFDESLWKIIHTFFEGIPFYNIYGITELLSWVVGESSPSENYQEGHVGIAWDAEIKIIKEKPSDDIGEIYIKTKYQSNSYFNSTEESRWEDGWFKTGDIGKLEENNHLYITGRIDDVINLGGVKIYPNEINQLVLSNSDIAEAYTIGIEFNGLKKIITFIIPKQSDFFHFDELIHQTNLALPVYKRPHDWIVLAEGPKNQRGKVTRHLLEEFYRKNKISTKA